MGTTLHKDLTGADLHVAKLHADTHAVAGTDPLTLAESQVTDLTADLADKAETTDPRLSDARTPSVHTHPESEVTDLVSDLSGKAALVHLHVKADITDFPTFVAGTGAGDVVGPASAVDTHLAVFDATTGKLIKDGGACTTAGLALLDDADAAAQITTLGAVATTDARLSDARTPVAHTHALAAGATDVTATAAELNQLDNVTLGTAAAKNIPATGNAATTEVVYGSDTRLADARTPSAHTHLLAAGATDVTATAAELNVLDGITATITELNYTDGVTSAIQTQLGDKLALAGGTMTGVLYSQANTSYTTAQVRNVIESTGDASGGGTGDIWIKYSA